MQIGEVRPVLALLVLLPGLLVLLAAWLAGGSVVLARCRWLLCLLFGWSAGIACLLWSDVRVGDFSLLDWLVILLTANLSVALSVVLLLWMLP